MRFLDTRFLLQLKEVPRDEGWPAELRRFILQAPELRAVIERSIGYTPLRQHFLMDGSGMANKVQYREHHVDRRLATDEQQSSESAGAPG